MAEEQADNKKQVADAFLHYMAGTGDFVVWQPKGNFEARHVSCSQVSLNRTDDFQGNNPLLVWQQFKRCSAVVKLADFAILLLGLVVNQASNERSFSDIKIKKTRLHNRLGIPKLEKMSKVGIAIDVYHVLAHVFDSLDRVSGPSILRLG